jgi:O-antigen ligase
MEKLMQILLISVLSLVTLSVSSWNMLDPFNLPKLTLLVPLSLSIGGLSFAILIKRKTRESFNVNLKLLVVPVLFIVNLAIVALLDSRDISSKLYGTWGRNTGLLAYLSLAILLVASIIFSTHQTISKVLKSFVFTCYILAFYGTLQSFGLEIFNYETQTSSQVFSTFGNPNFHSAFMGLGAIVGSLYLLSRNLKIGYKVGLVGLVVLCLYNVYESSAQGFFVWILGISFGTLLFLFMRKQFVPFWGVLCSSLLGFILLVLGFVNIGPFAPYIFNLSVQVRGYYWMAGLKMMQNKPIFGVGLDGYGDWYLRSRSNSAYSYSPKLKSDTAHNLIVDIGASGGLPLLLLYLALIFLALVRIVIHVKNAQKVELNYIVLCSIWFGFQMQSLISINQLGLGVWGWVLTGLIIGYPKSELLPTFQKKKSVITKSPQNKLVGLQLPASSAIVMFTVGLLITVPQYSASSKYYRALQNATVSGIAEAAYIKPYERYRFLYSAAILSENGFHSESESVLKFASTLYPNSFDLWRMYSENPKADRVQIDLAKSQMKRLDPLNVTSE